MRIPTDNMFQQQLNTLSNQYSSIARLMMQQSSGKNLLANSDDPVLASRANLTYDYMQNIQSYSQNLIVAKNRSQLFDTTIKDVVSKVGEIKEILVRAATDTISDDQRVALAVQLKGYLNTLLNAANARDGNDEYIYSGTKTNSMPYIFQNGKYLYQGNLTATRINISDNVSSLYCESGFSVFGDMLNGNGRFTVVGASTNTGAATTSPGAVVNDGSYVADTYTLSFVTNSSGKLAYQVIGATSGQVIPPPPATVPADAPDYAPDSTISFNGMTLDMAGMPKVGDTFTIAPSEKENIFDGLTNIINLLQTPINNDPAKRALFHQQLSQSNTQFSMIFEHANQYRSDVGTRLQVIDNQEQINATMDTNQKAIYGSLSDVKMEKVITDLSQQMGYLQATQACYKMVQDVLMQLLQV